MMWLLYQIFGGGHCTHLLLGGRPNQLCCVTKLMKYSPAFSAVIQKLMMIIQNWALNFLLIFLAIYSLCHQLISTTVCVEEEEFE
jgi:hypothetical protein